ncbi:GYF domain-containing protein [Cryptosporidium ryanae]|uniref:GYF domain-containing protein n=1 Tax=Cryptosporidium ryanae TaxID=515981 RepID=UPI003519EE1E|nr:GYF domain-containing protein [Cryptosporidium ryanae]
MLDLEKLREDGGEIGVSNSNSSGKTVYSINKLLVFYKPLNIPKIIYKLEDVEYRIHNSANRSPNSSKNNYHNRQSGYLEHKFRDKQHNKTYSRKYQQNRSADSSINKIMAESLWRECDRSFNLGFSHSSISNYVEHKFSVNKNNNKQNIINNKFELNRSGLFNSETTNRGLNSNYLNKTVENLNQISTETDCVRFRNILSGEYPKREFLHHKTENIAYDNSSSKYISGSLENGIIHFNENIVNELVDNRNLCFDVLSDNSNAHNLNKSDFLYTNLNNNLINSGLRTNIDLLNIKDNIDDDYYFATGNCKDYNIKNLNEINGGVYISKNYRLNKINSNITNININTDNSNYSTYDDERYKYFSTRKDKNDIQYEKKEMNTFEVQTESTEMEAINDDLEKPLWFFREVNSTIIHGPYSTKEMKNLTDNCKISVNLLLFSTVNKRIWRPLNIYYPYLENVFKYVPNSCLDVEYDSGILDTNKHEDESNMEKIVSNVSKLDVKDSDSEIDSNSVSRDLKSHINNKKDEEPEVGAVDNNQIDFEDNEKNSQIEVSLESSEIAKVSDSSHLSTELEANLKKPAWNISGDEGKKYLTSNFEDILKEEERIFMEDKLKKKIQGKDNNNPVVSGNTSNTTKCWKKINTDFTVHPLDIYNNSEETDSEIKKQANSQILKNQTINNASLNSTLRNDAKHGKWKGWGTTGTVNANESTKYDNFVLGSRAEFSQINANYCDDKKGFWDLCRSNNSENDKKGKTIVENRKNLGELDTSTSDKFKLDNKDNNKVISNQVSKNKRKKGVKVDSSLLSFGIRYDRPRNLNHDLD